mmetsp:Transcript_5171/g.13608  ORF Transcript_5171/g.13608 Transcript_5171/m.13608 type:complete len:323 (-) Transcript_5171:243-1211(-)
MATRSRTAIYMRFRESLRSHRPGPRTTTELRDFKVHKNLLAAHSDDEGSTVDARVYSVPPLWVSLVDDMNRDIARIKIKISELNTSTGKALLPGFADDDDQEEHISNTVGEVSTLFKDCERRLKELINSKDEGTDDESVRKNIERRVAQQLQDLGGEFRKGHKTYLAKLKGQTIEEYKPDLSFNEGPSASGGSGGFFDDDEDGGAGCTDPRFSAAQTLQLVMAERMTEEREAAITKVAESVGELAEIFKEIQVLVIDQGTILDRIDYNIEQAADRVVQARGEIEKANDYQKKSRTMLCIYLLLLLCGFMVIVLILKKTALSR